jgi:hypothetical protein
VILTPEYQKYHSLEDSLSKYDENLETPEYRKGDLSDWEKISFIEYYAVSQSNDVFFKEDYKKFKKGFIKAIRGRKGFVTKKAFIKKYPSRTSPEDYLNNLIYSNKEKFVEYFKTNKPELYASFEQLYAKNGDDWNGMNWRKDPNGVWGVYSTYNPNSKWDWYANGGRWAKSIKTKSGEFVDECLLGEIDFTPFPDEAYEDSKDWLGNPCKKLKEGYEWHYDNKDNFPFCIVIDGEWYEKGEMGWWGMTHNEKENDDWHGEVTALLEKLPADSEVYNVDFHI